MQETTTLPTAEDLHQHIDSLRGLASALVGEANADDLLSSTYIRALERPPKSARNTKAWLARVMRNLAVDQGRSDRSRAGREGRVCEPHRSWGPEDFALRKEANGILIQTLQGLDFPKQEVLTLRYFEGLDPSEIATKLDLTVTATRVRITRALAAMRRNLKSRYGKDWMDYCYLVLGTPVTAGGLAAPKATTKGALHSRSGMVALLSAIFVTIVAVILPTPSKDLAPVLAGEAASTQPGLAGHKADQPNSQPERTPLFIETGFETVYVLDHKGDPVPDASVSILGDEYLWEGKRVSGKPGLLRVGPKGGLVEKDRELMLLITSFGHAPFLGALDTSESHRVIKLPRRSVVSGQADLTAANKSSKHFILLGLEKMQPRIGSKAYKFRESLTRAQRTKFDDAFHSVGAEIQPDGYFEIDGMDPDWDGPLIYQNQIHSLVGSMPWNGSQVFWVYGPRSDIYLTLVERHYAEGEIVGADMFNRISMGEVTTSNGTSLTHQTHLDEDSGLWRIYADNFSNEELMVQLFVDTGSMKVPIKWLNKERTRFSVQVKNGNIRTWRFVDESGHPLPHVKIRKYRGDILTSSDSNGVASLITYGDCSNFVTEHPDRLRALLDIGLLEETVMLYPRVGIGFELPSAFEKSGGQRWGDNGLFLRIRSPKGLAKFGEVDGEQFFADQHWSNIEFDPASGSPIEARVYLSTIEPTFIGNHGIAGDVECTLFDAGEPIWRRLVPKSMWDGRRVIKIGVHKREERSPDFQALGPNGQPMRYARVLDASRNGGRSFNGFLDGYGMGNSDSFDPETPLVICQPGYHPSPIFKLKDLCLKQNREVHLSPARTVTGDAGFLSEYFGGQDLLLEAIRPSDEFVFERHSGGGAVKFICCPLAPFKVRASTESWSYEYWCGESQESLDVELPKAVEIEFSVSEEKGFPLSDLSTISFEGAFGKWTSKSFRLESDGRVGMAASIPGFTDIRLAKLRLLNGETIEVAPEIRDNGAGWTIEL